MATPKGQRIGIWIIAIVMSFGAVGMYFVAILANNNDTAKQQDLMGEYQKQADEAKKAQEARLATLRPLEGYTAEAFDATGVTELVKTDFKVGEGKEVTQDSTIEANYFGWTADGKIFDSTNAAGVLSPIEFSLQGVITGWTEGLAGAKEGSIRKLVIPTDMAYGEGAASQGRPAGPLAFVVEVVSVK